jgi:hypothetical protein
MEAEKSKYFAFPIKKRRRIEKQEPSREYSATTQAANFCDSSTRKFDYRAFYTAAEWERQKVKVRRLMNTADQLLLMHLDQEKPVCNLKKAVMEKFSCQMITYVEICNCTGHDLLFFGHKCGYKNKTPK